MVTLMTMMRMRMMKMMMKMIKMRMKMRMAALRKGKAARVMAMSCHEVSTQIG